MMIFGGAGAFVSYPEDLCRFRDSLFGGELISESSLTYIKIWKLDCGSMMTICTMVIGEVFHRFRSLFEYYEADRTCIAYTMNTHHYKPDAIAIAMKKAAKGEVVELPKLENVKLSQAKLQSYEGIYASTERPDYLIFIPHKGDLYIQESDAVEFFSF